MHFAANAQVFDISRHQPESCKSASEGVHPNHRNDEDEEGGEGSGGGGGGFSNGYAAGGTNPSLSAPAKDVPDGNSGNGSNSGKNVSEKPPHFHQLTSEIRDVKVLPANQNQSLSADEKSCDITTISANQNQLLSADRKLIDVMALPSNECGMTTADSVVKNGSATRQGRGWICSEELSEKETKRENRNPVFLPRTQRSRRCSRH